MGGFVLIKRQQNDDIEKNERQFRDSLDVFAKKGLPLNKRLIARDHIIYVFHKYQPKDDNTVLFDNGDFISAVGTLMYNRKTGPSALKELFRDFSVEKQDFSPRLLGNYCLIIWKGSNLFLCNSLSGVYRVYTDQKNNVISSSLLAVHKSINKPNIETQELYEYLFDGTFHGEKTLINEINLIDTTSILQLSPAIANISKLLSFPGLDSNISIDEMVREVAKSLIDYFSIIKTNFNNSVCAGLTAGSDTRLMLACMRKVGIDPYLYVYGKEHEPNVKVARNIAACENLNLDVEEVSQFPIIGKDEYLSFLEKQFYFNDGLGYAGIFNNGSDLSTRFKRIGKAQLQLNGAGDLGTLYYSWPDKPISISSVIKGKYDRGDYSMCNLKYFNKEQYLSTLQNKVKRILKSEGNKITRRQLESLLPLLRVKYWTGNNQMINNQLADALVPFCEPKFFHMTLDIPYRYKYLAVFKAALINHIDPVIAKYLSPQYGYSFNNYDKIPAKIKMKTFMRFNTPIMLRPYLRAHFWKQDNKGKFPYYLTKEYLDTIFPSSDLAISKYVDIDKVSDPDMLSRVLSVELLLNGRF